MTNEEKKTNIGNIVLGTVILVGCGVALAVGGQAIVKKLRHK